MKVIITKGATDQTVYVFVPDSSSTTGEGLTGLAYNTASLTCYYVRPLAAAAQLTLATQTVTGAHSDGGFVEVSAANLPGWYRLDLSDAIVASGVNSVGVQLKGAADMAPVNLEIQLIAANLQDAVRGGLTALPNANADAAGGLIISDAGGLDADAMRSDVAAILVDTADMQPKLGTFENLGSGATIAGNLEDMAYDGSATYSRTTDSLQAIRDAGATLTDLGILASTTIATMASQTSFTLTAGSADDNAYNDCRAIVTDASTAVQKAIGTILDYTGSTKTITLVADPGIFTMAVGDGIVIIPPAGSGASAASIADAVWDEAIAGHLAAGSTGEALSDAGAAGTPPTAGEVADAVWDEARSGHVAAGSFGEGVASVQGNVTGSVASVTTVNDKTGYRLSATGVDDVWDEAQSGHTSAGTFGRYLDAQVANVEADTQDLQGRTPAALVSGRMDASVGAMAANVMTAAAANADLTTELQAGLATAAALATAQADLDILTGADGAVIASGTQTFNMTGNITGSLSGSVGSVSGAVGSVTGNVGGNVAGSVGSVTALSAGAIDSILDEALTELSAVPAAAPSLRAAMQFLYMAIRNRTTTTASEQTIQNDAGGTIATATLSDDGVTYSKGEFV